MNARCNSKARANWLADYRSARKVRRFMDSMSALHGSAMDMAADLNLFAFDSAARVNGQFCNGGDPLTYMAKTRLLWVKAGCPMRLPNTGRLPA